LITSNGAAMKKLFFFFVIAVIFLPLRLSAQEQRPAAETNPPPAKEKSLREVYGEFYRALTLANFAIGRQEGAKRSGHFGLGAAGSLTERFDTGNWQMSGLKDGFLHIELDYWWFEFGNLALSGGYHSDATRSVIPWSAMVQLLLPVMNQLEKNPVLGGIQLGVSGFPSSLAEESTTCFKLGFCTYMFENANFATTFEVNWLSPAFRENNWEAKAGMKYFFF